MRDIKNKNIKWWISTISVVALFSFIGIFAYMKMSFILKGVQIKAQIENLNNGGVANIRGNAKNATFISLNGREIYINKNGEFKEPIALIPGFSVITINTHDKFGKVKEKKFQLVYKESEGVVAFINK